MIGMQHRNWEIAGKNPHRKIGIALHGEGQCDEWGRNQIQAASDNTWHRTILPGAEYHEGDYHQRSDTNQAWVKVASVDHDMEVRCRSGNTSDEVARNFDRRWRPEHKVDTKFLAVVLFAFRGFLPIGEKDYVSYPHEPNSKCCTLNTLHNYILRHKARNTKEQAAGFLVRALLS